MGAAGCLSVPLAADGRTVGALNLYARRSDAFGPGDVGETLLRRHNSIVP